MNTEVYKMFIHHTDIYFPRCLFLSVLKQNSLVITDKDYVVSLRIHIDVKTFSKLEKYCTQIENGGMIAIDIIGT